MEAIPINPPALTFAGADDNGFRAALERARQQWEAFKRKPLLSERKLPYLTFHEWGVPDTK